MRTASVIALVLAAVLASHAQSETLQQLKQRADAAEAGDKARLGIEVARVEVEQSDKLFTEGKVEDAHAMMKEAADYAAAAGRAAVASGKRLKETEISLRKLARRISDIKRTLAFEDQPDVQNAIGIVDKARTEVLERMFGIKEKKS